MASGPGERLWETGQTDKGAQSRGRETSQGVLAPPRQKPKAWTDSVGTGLIQLVEVMD